MTRWLTLLLVVLLPSPGCKSTPSLGPVVTADKLAFDPALVGDYRMSLRGGFFSGGLVRITAAGNSGYAFTVSDDKGVVVGRGLLRLVKLGAYHFYELSSVTCRRHDGRDGEQRLSAAGGAELYFVGRVDLGPDSLIERGFPDPRRPDGELVAGEFTGTGEDGVAQKGLAVRMPAAAFQTYLLRHAAEMTDEGITLRRAAAAPAR